MQSQHSITFEAKIFKNLHFGGKNIPKSTVKAIIKLEMVGIYIAIDL